MKRTNLTTLDTLCPGQRARIDSLCCSGALHRRLEELGMVKDTEIQCLYRGPGGTPIACCVRGTVIALRTSDAASIRICME